MQKQNAGFTLSEVLIAIALISIIAALVIPKILNGTSQKMRDAEAKEIFTTVGELFMACQDSGSCNTSGANWTNSPVTDGRGVTVNSVANQFKLYLQNHLDYTNAPAFTTIVNPTPGPANYQVMNTPITLATGAQIGTFNIPATGLAGNATMSIDLTVPNNPSFAIYFALNGSRVTRYTTKFGQTNTVADKTFMDTSVLEI